MRCEISGLEHIEVDFDQLTARFNMATAEEDGMVSEH